MNEERQIISELKMGGKTTQEIVDALNEKGMKRPDGSDFRIKDVNNRLMAIRISKGIAPKKGTNVKRMKLSVVLKKTNLNQRQLAMKIGVAPVTLQGWKKNGVPPKYNEAIKALYEGGESIQPKREHKPRKPKVITPTVTEINEVVVKSNENFVLVYGKSSTLLKEVLGSISM